VQWEIQKDSVVIELYGRISEDEYMAFGLSGANGRSEMVNIVFKASLVYHLIE
jgi:hypothetical protein